MWRQNTYVSRVCRTRAKATCVTSTMFTYEKFWPDFGVTTRSFEVVLGAWKGVPYSKRFCQGYDLGKVEDEEHLLLVCPNTQKVSKCFCSTIPLTHTSTFVELM